MTDLIDFSSIPVQNYSANQDNKNNNNNILPFFDFSKSNSNLHCNNDETKVNKQENNTKVSPPINNSKIEKGQPEKRIKENNEHKEKREDKSISKGKLKPIKINKVATKSKTEFQEMEVKEEITEMKYIEEINKENKDKDRKKHKSQKKNENKIEKKNDKETESSSLTVKEKDENEEVNKEEQNKENEKENDNEETNEQIIGKYSFQNYAFNDETKNESFEISIYRDLFLISRKLIFIISPFLPFLNNFNINYRFNYKSKNDLRQWDLYTPMIIIFLLSFTISLDINFWFIILFTAIFGSFITFLNCIFLEVNISFFQIFSMVGYSLIPLSLGGYFLNFCKYILGFGKILRFIIGFLFFDWSWFTIKTIWEELFFNEKNNIAFYPAILMMFKIFIMVLIKIEGK